MSVRLDNDNAGLNNKRDMRFFAVSPVRAVRKKNRMKVSQEKLSK